MACILDDLLQPWQPSWQSGVGQCQAVSVCLQVLYGGWGDYLWETTLWLTVPLQKYNSDSYSVLPLNWLVPSTCANEQEKVEQSFISLHRFGKAFPAFCWSIHHFTQFLFYSFTSFFLPSKTKRFRIWTPVQLFIWLILGLKQWTLFSETVYLMGKSGVEMASKSCFMYIHGASTSSVYFLLSVLCSSATFRLKQTTRGDATAALCPLFFFDVGLVCQSPYMWCSMAS